MSRTRRRPRGPSLDLLAAAGLVLGGIAIARTARARRRIDLAGRVAVITGGSRGLGLVLARELVREGAKVAICARDQLELARAADQLETLGADVLALTCDVTRPEEVEEAFAQVRERLGPIDILINNAGVIQVGPLEAMTPEDYDHALQVHFWGPLHTSLAVLPEMRRRKAGRIVNIASVGGKISVPHLLPYSASKFALVGFSQGLRSALAADGVFVTTVCPGLMRTGSPPNASFKARHRAEFAWFSISDSLPLLSMDATEAARRILAACRFGDAELVMPASTAAAVALNALFPGVGAALLSVADRLLPGPGGIGTATRRGTESRSRWSPSALTRSSDEAAARNNELARRAGDRELRPRTT
jgi:NAD(P)-dependent dehydrogenase (short-subunit alcohol dehydrogenase family)